MRHAGAVEYIVLSITDRKVHRFDLRSGKNSRLILTASCASIHFLVFG